MAYTAYGGLVFLIVAMGVRNVLLNFFLIVNHSQAIYWYGIEQGNFEAADHDEIVYATFSLSRIPKFFGVAAFLFCVHSMVRFTIIASTVTFHQ